MEKNTTLNLRVNSEIKRNAEEVLARLGISMSAAIGIYLNQIYLTGGIPFAVTLPKVPEAVNADLMTDTELRAKLENGYMEGVSGKTQDAREAFTASDIEKRLK